MSKIHNVLTNIVGRTRIERIVSGSVWQKEIQPCLDAVLQGPSRKEHRARIGQWVVEYIGNNDHMHEFFTKNWKQAPAGSKPHVRSYVLTEMRDREAMKRLLGLRSEEDVRAHHESFRKALGNPKFRAGIRDPRLREMDRTPEKKQLEIALFAPATVYSSEERAFVSINTNYYGQLKSKSSLGPLEEYLIRKAKVGSDGKILNPEEVWISMHAGCVEVQTEKGERRGIVIIAPTGTGKSTQCYGLVEAKKENRLHSDDWVFVNLGSREVLTSEERFYMRTNIAEIYPHLIPLLVFQPLENVAFTPDIIEVLERFESPEALHQALENGKIAQGEYRKIIAQMVENNAARSLIDPRLMVGPEKFVEKTTLTDLFLMKRDFDSSDIIQIISEDQMIEIMTSADNVFNYEYGKVDLDGYGIAQNPSTEIYYNPYLCVVEVDRKKGVLGELDKIRIEAYRSLVRDRGVKASWVNTRLPAHETQLCIRKFLEGKADGVRLAKGPGVESALLARLGLTQKEKPLLPGRRPIDGVGFFDKAGREVEIVCFYEKGKLVDTMTLPKPAKTGSLVPAR